MVLYYMYCNHNPLQYVDCTVLYDFTGYSIEFFPPDQQLNSLSR